MESLSRPGFKVSSVVRSTKSKVKGKIISSACILTPLTEHANNYFITSITFGLLINMLLIPSSPWSVSSENEILLISSDAFTLVNSRASPLTSKLLV